MKKIFITILSLSTLVLTLESCRESDLEPTLAQQKDIAVAINDVEDISTVLNSAYDFMSSEFYYGRDYIIYGEVRSDNTFANLSSNRFTNVAQFNQTTEDRYANETWRYIYRVIANANIVIGLENDNITGDQNMFKQLLGEAYALRALSHFDLVKIYGQYSVGTGGMSALGVPYVTTFANEEYIYPSRNTVQEVYDMAMADLDKAISLVNQNRGNAYISLPAIYAIKARMALYFKKYDVAKDAAKQVIDLGGYTIVPQSGFLSVYQNEMSVAPNVIFGMENTTSDNLAINGLANIYRKPGYGDIEVLSDLYNIYEAGDVRGASDVISVGGPNNDVYTNVGKFPDLITFADDTPLIRYEEVVLTYAEALLQTGDAQEALVWLNKVPAQRGASLYTVATLDNILLERRKEFAFEGFRFFDLLRTERPITKVSSKQNITATIPYGHFSLAFPIPSSELGANSSVVQNQGY